MGSPPLRRLVPEASPALQGILDDARGPLQPPVRSEIFGPQRFAQHGRSLGDTHRAARASAWSGSFFPRLASNIATLREAHAYLGTQAATGYDVSPAAEWLLDNFHLIEAQLKEIRDGLPRRYFGNLPLLLDEPLAGLPRVYGVAWAFVAHTDGAFDDELLAQYLIAYQETRELHLSEMWALPTTLRVVLIENLRRLAERVAATKAAREVANLCCDRLGTCPLSMLDELHAQLDRRGVGRAFLTQMAQRMQDLGGAGEPPMARYHAWLRAALPEPASMQAQERADQTADNLSVSNAVGSLRAIGDADWPDIVARTSALMRLMRGAPLFEAEHAATRSQTLHAIEALAQRGGRSELAVATALLDLMQTEGAESQVAGHWLQGPGRAALLLALQLPDRPTLRHADPWKHLARAIALPAYLGALLLGTVGLVAWMLMRPDAMALVPPAWAVALAALLMALPASEAVVAVINRLISESTRPGPLPRLALAAGVPAEHRVLVVIPSLLTDAASTARLAHRLQLHHLANPERHAQFALLTDWADAASATTDDDAARLADAVQQIDALNARYPASGDGSLRFLLLHRARGFSTSEQRWIGWERKRGKLEQLVALMRDGQPGAFTPLGATSRIAPSTPYLVTLDSDTQLPPGRLRELVGVAAHPANRPRLDASGRFVAQGYGILQPRIVTPLPLAREVTPFHSLFSGHGGVDPYSAATSEVYQDLFGEGSFAGKGLIHVAAMHAVLAGRLPEGQVLSHDLLEGSLLRCAAVTDITLIEDAPFHADVAASRVHRWTRGDWQLLPLLLQPRRFPLRAINRWKMADNLRRSLVAPASLALLLLALLLPVVSPWATLALVLAAFTAGPLMGAIAGLSPSRDDIAKRHFYREAGRDLGRALAGGLWHLALLLQQARLALDAIARALYRTVVSRRHLLQWTTAAAAQASATTGWAALARRHRLEPVLALLLTGALVGVATAGETPAPPMTIALAVALGLLWAAAPLAIAWVSRPRPARADAALSDADRVQLEGIARDTWRLFERCVGPDDHHLPPDNLQTLPHDMVAHRTSPSNIGLYLLSVACARAFGWIGTHELIARLDATLATLATLQRHRGHFLNWYDTRSAAPLLPMYVSTVDSGNLSGHLLAVAQACRELARAPLDAAPQVGALGAARERVAMLLARRRTLTPVERSTLRWRLADLRAQHRSIEREAAAWARPDDDTDGASGPAGARSRSPLFCTLASASRLRALADHCEALAWQADFGFLYHRRRHLFHIGFRVAEQALDAGFYDLLASESRLTSLLAIAKGDVPVGHWAALGRPFYAVGTRAGLRSWSGSMFEYLMPTLVLAEPQGSVLREACEAALQEQVDFARGHALPWGISESAYAARDHTLAYQYAPQGVPRLALRRTPPDELVIAPYATVLATQVAPHAACRNLAVLDAMGARGRYGFIEALDFTPGRHAGAVPYAPVSTFMAHHQGMSIVALANVLLDGAAQRWGMADPHIEAVASLLHERTPREVSLHHAPPSGAPPQALARRAPGLLREVLPGQGAIEPTHLLSNGRYSVSLRANGAGQSRWGAVGLSRSRDDALRDAQGHFFYLRWDQQPRPVSITQHPAPDPAAHYKSTFHADRVAFDTTWREVQAHCTVWVSPEDDIEFRQVELRNLGDRALELELLSAFEVTLADPRADEAHPAFTNLFVRAAWQPAHQALLFERTPRLATERGLRAAHFLAEGDPQVVGLRLQTDRQRWLGRNRDASRPLASFDAPPAGDGAALPLDTGLDPVAALAVRVRLAPQGKARLTFATAACDDAGTLQAVIDKYRQPGHVQRASLMSATLTGIRLTALQIGAEDHAAVQTMSTALLMSLTRPRRGAAAVDATPPRACDRRLLWRFGISGDRPLILVAAASLHGLGLLRSIAQAMRLWAWGGVACDLVVLNAEPASYQMPLQHELTALRDRHASEGSGATAALTGFHVLQAEELSPEETGTLQALACLRLHADGRPLLHHVRAWTALHEQAFEERHAVSTTAVPVAAPDGQPPAVAAGRFDTASGAFRFDVAATTRPIRPWINVLANPGFGAHLSETGGGYTWARNSRLHQLTAWSNDPVGDTPSEWFLLQDSKTRQVWSVAPSAWGDERARYTVTHAPGHSSISHRHGDLEVTASWCVDAETAVKQVRLRLVNRGTRSLALRVIGLAEWMMGAGRADRRTVHTALHRQALPAREPGAPPATLLALMATQRDHAAGFGDGTAFLATTRARQADDGAWSPDRAGAGENAGKPPGAGGAFDAVPGAAPSIAADAGPDRAAAADDRAGDDRSSDDWTCDRRECFDARGALVMPDHLGRRSGAGLDPCAALSVPLTLAAGDEAEQVFLIGHADSPAAAQALAARAAAVPAAQRVAAVRAQWDALLDATTVRTPDPLFDVMVNRWLLYQSVACRLWAKAGFYQAGGATGFRDQLQDAMALAWAAPRMLREQILRCASRQFAEGDVQHWWHAPTGAGVRTHFSDDLLWLPHACAHHLRRTGDATLLDEIVPFLEGGAIPEGAEDLYETPRVSPHGATVFEHACRALDRSLRVGVHGLPLMGTGDWNDGMNRVGHEGRGESVWLGWFLCRLVADFAPLARARGEPARADRWEAAAVGWRQALNGTAWDGRWFKRAFFDDGQALGSHENDEGRIDLIAQAWAVRSGAARPDLQATALASMDEWLVDREHGLIRLLDPPLVHAQPSAGYIQGYPGGVRENGGQYSHAGVWALMAQAEHAQPNAGDTAYRYFTYLSPAHRAAHAQWGPAYGLEPYVMAGDVYSQPPYAGRGGWSWYTGAAAWLHRAAIESMFGLQHEAQTLRFAPCLPAHWPLAELTLRREGRTMRFVLVRATADGALAAAAATLAGTRAELLHPGQALAWTALPAQSCFVLPLLHAPAADPGHRPTDAEARDTQPG